MNKEASLLQRKEKEKKGKRIILTVRSVSISFNVVSLSGASSRMTQAFWTIFWTASFSAPRRLVNKMTYSPVEMSRATMQSIHIAKDCSMVRD